MKKELLKAFEADLRIFARAGFDGDELRRVALILSIGAGDLARVKGMPCEALLLTTEVSTPDLYSIVDKVLSEVKKQ